MSLPAGAVYSLEVRGDGVYVMDNGKHTFYPLRDGEWWAGDDHAPAGVFRTSFGVDGKPSIVPEDE